MTKRLLLLILNIVIVCMFIGCYSSKQYNNYNQANDELIIKFFDAGKADCILIGIQDKYIMIYTGLDKNKNEISTYLKSQGIDSLEYLILTHMDKDHIGGADEIINKFKISNLIQPDYKKESNQYEEYEEAIEKSNIQPTLLHEEISVKIDNVEIKICPPKKDEYKKSNDYSIIVEINYKDKSFLFMGDAEEERIKEFLKYNKKYFSVIKMPHHGRVNNMTENLIENTKPQYSIITSSKEETADDKTILILEKYNVKNYFTENGDITIKSDGKDISISQ